MAGTKAASPRPRYAEHVPHATKHFVWSHSICSAVFVAGVSVDLWAHNNIRPLFETFFTPWHGLLYGGFVLLAAQILSTLLLNHRRSRGHWSRSLPAGYELTPIGVGIFVFGGIFDLIWHSVFGIEADLDALVSPSHLLLLLGAFLMVGAPLRGRAAASQAQAPWSVALAALLSLTVLVPFFAFFTSPFAIRGGAGPVGGPQQVMQLLASVTYSALLVGAFLSALRLGPLPVGSGMLIVGVNAAQMTFIRALTLGEDRLLFLALAVLAGLSTDLLLVLLKPDPSRPKVVHLFAATLPLVVLGPYFAVIAIALPVSWSIHALVGVVALGVGAGALLGSLVALPEGDLSGAIGRGAD
jgi:hypothetical protein